MSKIKTITVSNAKAITDFTADFNGMTAILTAGNNKGKTTFLRSLFDRIRGVKPETILKTGTDAGFIEHVLTTGEKLRWEFNDKGKEKLIYTTEKNIKTSLTTELRTKFLPEIFDVDEFLQSPPMKQRKTLQALAGLDFTDIDARYKLAYDERAATNKSYSDQKVKFESMPVAVKVDAVSMEVLLAEKEVIKKELNDLYLANKAKNTEAKNAWLAECEVVRNDVADFNQRQTDNRLDYNGIYDAHKKLQEYGFVHQELNDFVAEYRSRIKPDKITADLLPKEPTYIEELPNRDKLDAKDAEINTANEVNRKALLYTTWLSEKTKTANLSVAAIESNKKVSTIEQERSDLIKTANMPEGFSFSTEGDGILYNGLPFTREQLSSSGIYIGALKLASLRLGEIRCLHFDASFLDKNSLLEIEQWANGQDLQLLIERPDFDGGEIEYQLIQN